MKQFTHHSWISRCLLGAMSAVISALTWPLAAYATPPSLPISQTPITVSIPAHPQIVLAVTNSQSMDGDLSGAIWTGAGSLGGGYPELLASSSPTSYTIPTGFTPPANQGSGGVAPYTVISGGNQIDNSASRLNVAKAGITAILNNYISSADFALYDYSTSGLNLYTTWVYQMSNPGGFTFSSSTPSSGEYVANPCYHVNFFGPSAVSYDCRQLQFTHYTTQDLYNTPYMWISASSDDAAINDVLYASGGIDPLCVTYGGVYPATPYTAPYNLSTYNYGGVLENYGAEVNSCATVTGPTNAGFVPYSTEVMYELRGFGYYTNGESATSGTQVVPMTSSGATPTPTSVANAIAQFTPYLDPETSSAGTPDIKASATQGPIAGLISGAATYISGLSTSSNGCAAQKYIVLLTDGLPTLDLNGLAWPPLGSAAASGYGVTAVFNSTTHALVTTNDQALTDVINQITAAKSQGVTTYIIGLGAGVNNPTSAAGQTLTAMAVAGGSGGASATGYFPATSPQDVTNDLSIIITKILAATQSTSSAAVNSTGLNTSSVVYQSQFDTADSNQDWTGNLNAFPVVSLTAGSVNTSASSALWSAQHQLDLQSWDTGRFIATWDPNTNGGTPFEWSSGTPTTGIASSTTLGQQLSTFPPDTNGRDVLQFLRGYNGKEKRYSGGTFRNRTHKLGDIVNSNPLYVGVPSANNQTPSYVAFATANATRQPVIYVGADDGMLHAFNASVPPGPYPTTSVCATCGNELFAYVPQGSYSKLVDLVSPYYNGSHQFYVNGSPQASDVQFSDLSWHTVLVGTEAQGGNSVFALDVTSPATLSTSEASLASAVLWDFTDGDMGLTFSTPAIANTADGWQVFVGNGYNSPNEKPVLYALNPQTGAVTLKLDLCAMAPVTSPTVCDPTLTNGLSSVAAVNSSGIITGYADVVYAGDLQGNMWRVNVTNANPAMWTVSVLFQATDSLGNRQPITTAPVVSLNPKYPGTLGTMVFFGTGELLGSGDLTNTQTQTIYGIFDPPNGYAVPMNRTTGALVQQTLSTAIAYGVTVDQVTGNAVSIPSNKGWYIDLSLDPGERVVTDPRLESGGALVLTSYEPIVSGTGTCSVSGQSTLYVLNFASGSSFPSPQFDLNGDGSITTADQATNGTTTFNPVGVSLGNVFASAPTIRTASMQTASAVKLISESSGTIKMVVEKGSSKSRTAWWEVRK